MEHTTIAVDLAQSVSVDARRRRGRVGAKWQSERRTVRANELLTEESRYAFPRSLIWP